MTTTRTKSIITIAILLIVLAVLSVVSLLTSQLGGGFGGGRTRTGFNGTPGPRTGNAQDGNAGGGFQGGDNNGGGGNFQGRGGGGGFNAFGITRQLGLNPQVFFFINIGIAVIGIVLLLLCAYGVWKQKKKALNGAIVLAILFLLAALPGLFFGARFNVRLVIDILQIGAAVTIIAMGVLPSVRDTVE